MRTPEGDAWIQRARDADIRSEAEARGAVLKRSGSELVGPCPVCGGTDRFSINVVKQIFNCRGSVGGDVIKMVEHIEGLTFLQAVEAINGEPLPGSKGSRADASSAERLKAQRAEADRRREAIRDEQVRAERRNRIRAGEIWRETVEIDASPAEVYLNERGIPKPPGGWPSVLRFHPRISYPDREGKFPALIARADDVRGVPVAIWRIYLSRDGRAKANVPNAKLGLGGVGGAAVRLAPISAASLGVGEGIESSLGAWSLLNYALPVWACLSTSGLAGFAHPAGLKMLTIFPDGDKPYRKKGEELLYSQPAGRAAALKLKQRTIDAGIACTIAAEPPRFKDYLDLWRAKNGGN